MPSHSLAVRASRSGALDLGMAIQEASTHTLNVLASITAGRPERLRLISHHPSGMRLLFCLPTAVYEQHRLREVPEVISKPEGGEQGKRTGFCSVRRPA
jgi:hypothetical protein